MRLICSVALAAALLQAQPQIPHLVKRGTATQLIVDGRPFLILGGELHNSSSSDLDYMAPIWSRMAAMNFNTVLAGVSWELIEPEEGKYDFGLVDGLLESARRNNVHLVFLWFGSWKNGMSSYVPLWVKKDYRRFERAKIQDGKTVEVLSTLCPANWEADARAFAALMRYLRAADSRDHTVVMIQVENEVGILRDSRDRSEAANKAFSQPAPKKLLAALNKTNGGSWEQVFGGSPETDELFMAWNYASYIEQVAKAGKAEYALPMYVNTWLSQPDRKPGTWPSGGPLPQVMEAWRAAAPDVDILAPDIYQPNFVEWCRRYTRGKPAVHSRDAEQRGWRTRHFLRHRTARRNWDLAVCGGLDPKPRDSAARQELRHPGSARAAHSGAPGQRRDGWFPPGQGASVREG